MNFFFNNHQKVQYKINDKFDKQVTDITTSVMLNRFIVDKSYIFKVYEMNDSESFESIANDLYGKPSYYWTILVANNIINPFIDKPNPHLFEYINKKYENSGGSTGIHHFINLKTKRIVDDYDTELFLKMVEEKKTLPLEIGIVTNFDFEHENNTNKRYITVISPNHINKFIEDYNNEIKDIESNKLMRV